jgi:hypothetical protein
MLLLEEEEPRRHPRSVSCQKEAIRRKKTLELLPPLSNDATRFDCNSTTITVPFDAAQR